MTLLNRLNALLDASTTPLVASAHCDLPCGVYDPAQARIEAQSVKGCMEKFNASTDTDFSERAIFIKEERCELVKHHLWVLWTDYFKPDHLKEYPNLQRPVLDGDEDSRRSEEDDRRRRRRPPARRDRRHRRDLLGHEEVTPPPATPGGRRHRALLWIA